ncbi:MAG: NADH-quinone oxidoreductase subunit NuoF [Clostridia bacterium]|nr:NADH-quinone oxidoreductase subunit NuoF [Clostridia bacterium]
MEKIRNFEDLARANAENAAKLTAKYDGTGGKKAIMLCGGTACVASNVRGIEAKFRELIAEKHLEDKVSVNMVGCFGLCSQGPFVKVFPENTLYRLVKSEDVEEILDRDIIGGQIVERLLYEDPETKQKISKQEEIGFYKKQKRIALYGAGVIGLENVEEALGMGAFKGLARALQMERKDVVQEVLDSGLRGRGGAGFPTGRKWMFAMNGDGDKYVVCNGDEGDPGAFMDRSVLEDNPYAVIEGMMIAGYAIGAQNGYFYVRAEYPVAVKRLGIAIKQLEELGLMGDNILGTGFSFRAHVRLGAGAFVCGEETALLNSIEGKRGMPRPRPPFPAVKGLWGKPTIVNNVETLATVPYVLREGVAEFVKYGTERSKGTKVFALGGKVNNVGLVEVPMGTTLRELIYEIGGGIQNGKKFKAIQTGGPSGGCLTEKDLDAEIDFDNLVARGSMMGSGGAIVMDEDNCMVDVAKFYMDFICDESCGKCSPCRIGTKRMLELLTKITDGKATMDDLHELEELSKTIKANSLCALGQTASNPVTSTLTQFRDEYIAHIVDKKCPAKVCKNLMQYVIDPDKCRKCGLCARQCPTGAITGVVGKEPFVIDQSKCIKCGMCMSSCKFKAIEKV